MKAFPSDEQISKWATYAAGPLRIAQQPFGHHIEAYEAAFQIKAQPPFCPLWYPAAPFVPQEPFKLPPFNISRFLEEQADRIILTSPSEHGYRALHRWSVERRGEFWQRLLIDHLQIPLQHKPHTVLSFPSRDISQPIWLEGAIGSVIDLLSRHPSEKMALIYEKESGEVSRWTYGDLIREIERVAGALYAAGVQVGDRIALCLPLRPEAVFLYLGAIYAGVSVATIPDSLSGEEIATRLSIAAPTLLFIQDGLYREGKFIPLYDRVQPYKLPRTFVLRGGDSLNVRLRNNSLPWESFLSEGIPLSEPVRGALNREIGVLFSSGTTAEPKAIPWTHLTALKALTDAYLYHDVQPSDTLTWPTNLGWMMGPWLLFAGLSHGATLALYEGSPTGEGFCRFVEKQRVTILGTVPSLVRRWIETGAWEGADWKQVRLFSSTGEASNPWHMWQLMAKAGYKPIIEYCGGTEIGGGYITSTLLHPNAPSQFSAPALGIDFILLDEEHRPSSEGELFLVPPSIGLSQSLLNADHEKVYYAGTPPIQPGWQGATGGTILPEWEGVPLRLRRHGDYMRQLPSGYWVSGGRADDAMNLGGIKVSSTEIERVATQVPGIGEAAAIAVPPPEGGPDRLILYIVVQAGYPSDPLHWKPLIGQAIREKLSPLFHLHDVVVVSELPRTASNKVMRRHLRSLYLQKPSQ